MRPEIPRKRVAVVQAFLVAGGGTEAVTAWMVEALKAEYDLTLISYDPVHLDELNRYYGTDLHAEEINSLRPKLPYPLDRSKRFLFLKDRLMGRYCRSIGRNFDLIINVGGVMDLGTRGIQYMSLAPGATLARVLEGDPSLPPWYRFMKRASMGLADQFSGSSVKRMHQNLTLVNSRWTGRLADRLYGISESRVVYPPVNSSPASNSWESRKDGFLCVARVSPEKRIEQVIEILRQVRQRGFDISLQVIGRHDRPDYLAKIQAMAGEDAPWVQIGGLMNREELRHQMDQHKYGINAAENEPFGIGPAEMVTSGCIVFLPNSGGQTEIVDDPRLTFNGVDDAVRKITEVMGSKELQRSLLGQLSAKRGKFSIQAFCSNIRDVVSGCLCDPQE